MWPYLAVTVTLIMAVLASDTWEFPKIAGTVFWGPYNKDPTI